MHKCCTEKHINDLILQVIYNNVICIVYLYLASALLNNFCVFHRGVWSSLVFGNECEPFQPIICFSISILRVCLKFVSNQNRFTLWAPLKIFSCPFSYFGCFPELLMQSWCFCQMNYTGMLPCVTETVSIKGLLRRNINNAAG